MISKRIEGYLRAIETDTLDEYHDYHDLCREHHKKYHKKHGETGLKMVVERHPSRES